MEGMVKVSSQLIVGLTGLPGSGKSTAAQAAGEMNIPVVVMGDVIRQLAAKKHPSPSNAQLRKLMVDIRRREGPAAVAKRTIPLVRRLKSEIVVVDGVRSLDEVEAYRRVFPRFRLIAVHASPRERFARLRGRARSDDSKRWEEFVKRDLAELKVGVGEAMALADEILWAPSVEELKQAMKERLRSISYESSLSR